MSPELLSPELFDLKGSRPTKHSDCYALGMVIYEVLSGQTPFAPSTVPAVMLMVLEGKRPGRPQEEEGKLFTDAIWGVLERCWKPRPSDRASAKAVLLSMGADPSSSTLTHSSADDDLEAGSDNRPDITAKGSGTFSPFHYRLTSDYPCGIEQPTTYLDDEPPATPPRHSSMGAPIGRIAHGARRVLRSLTGMIRFP